MENVTYKFRAKGMTCKSCSLIVEQELGDLSYVENVKADNVAGSVVVTGDFSGIPAEALATDFSTLLASHGYVLSVDEQEADKKQHDKINWSEFKIAIPIAIGFAIIFIILQKMGLVGLIDTGNKISYGTIFTIGVVASLSSCMAVVGGLLLSISAVFAKEDEKLSPIEKVKPPALFHIGRFISFFLLGGVIGVLGSAFRLNSTTSFILEIIIGLVMLIMGLDLLDTFHFTKKLQPSMPKFISKHALGVSKLNHTLTPLLVGVITFFLPCGFTQSMQIYTLSTGNFWTGAITMSVFALGTFPVLALLSFSSFSIKNSSKAGIFFKSAGLVVILLAVFNIINSLVVIGLIPPVFNF